MKHSRHSGATNRRLQTEKDSLTSTGKAPSNKRGTHKNRPSKTSEDTHKAHYSLKDSNKVYLPEHLNVKQLHALFLQQYYTEISYEMFRQTFVQNFNISFGYPRTDTCATFDEQKVKELSLEKSLEGATEQNKTGLEKELQDLRNSMKLHKLKAD